MKNNARIKFIGGLSAIVMLVISAVFDIDFVDDKEKNIPQQAVQSQVIKNVEVTYNEAYTAPEEVAAYLIDFQKLPPNYITKNEALAHGWEDREGNLQEVAPGASIGGDYFGNFEGLLPETQGRDYYEADVNYEGGFRGDERLVFSDDGLIFYTDDHYDSFTQIE